MTDVPATPMAPEAAQAEIARLKGDKAFGAAVLDPFDARHTYARQMMGDLHRLAYPEGVPAGEMPKAPAPVASIVLTPEAAKAKIAELVKDRDFGRRYLAGDAEARAEMERLHRTADPEPEGEAPVAEAKPPAPLPLEIGEGVQPAEAEEMHRVANDTVEALGLEAEMAAAGVQVLQRANSARDNRPMDSSELARMEAILERRWGVNYDAKMDALDRVFARARAKSAQGAEWLRQSMCAAGPEAAAWALDSLINLDGRTR